MRGIKKLSLKIILTLLIVMMAVVALTQIVVNILRGFGIGMPTYAEEFETWISVVTTVLPVVFGVIFISIGSYVLNKTVVSRIKKLKDATALVAKGNFENTLDVKGKDELSELTTSFNSMTNELKANEYLAKDFVRNISHEFKTPLSVIKAYAELIEGEAQQKIIDIDALKEYSNIIMNEADRLAALSKSIIQLSLLDSTTIIKKEDTFCPSEQIRSILRGMQVRWSDKNLEFELSLDESVVKNNEQLVYQIWQNLISNAIKFSPDGGKIKITLKNTESGLLFEVSDEGIGMTDDEKEKVFDQFYMADKSRNTEGSGLGLAIVKKIVDKLGGEIKVENNIEKGSIFKTFLTNL